MIVKPSLAISNSIEFGKKWSSPPSMCKGVLGQAWATQKNFLVFELGGSYEPPMVKNWVGSQILQINPSWGTGGPLKG